MRWLVAFCFLTFSLVSQVSAQDQERKLVDRLLRPDTELHNSAQNKKFTSDRTSVHKQATVGTFYVQEKPRPKQFVGSREFSAWEYSARSFQQGKQPANASSQKQLMNSETHYPTSAATGVHAANDANKLVDGQQFAGQRVFLDKGKSQKALNQQNAPLTIDEVRELLNKNK